MEAFGPSLACKRDLSPRPPLRAGRGGGTPNALLVAPASYSWHGRPARAPFAVAVCSDGHPARQSLSSTPSGTEGVPERRLRGRGRSGLTSPPGPLSVPDYALRTSSEARRKPVTKSCNRRMPRQSTLTPGSPSLLRPRKPPSFASQSTACARVGGSSGGALRL